MRQPISILAYLYRSTGEDWEYLLLRRVASPHLGLGDFWQGVTGGLEEGEDIEQAAWREIEEETGFKPSTLEAVECVCSFPIQAQWRKIYAPGVEEIVEHVFVACVDNLGDPFLSREHDRWQWCSLDQAIGLLTYLNNIRALKHCAAYLEAGSGPG